MEELVGKYNSVETEAHYHSEKEQWVVTVTLIQKRKKTVDAPWEEKKTYFRAYEKDLDKAVAECNNSLTAYLKPLKYDLFNIKDDKTYRISD